MMLILKLIRIKQWIKNFFLFAPLIFSLHLFDYDYYSKVFIGFFAFSFLASFIYILNDITDKESDRNHPEKKFRPIASGKISTQTALIIGAVLLISAIIITFFTNSKFIIALSSYFLINLLYSYKLKNIVLLDIFSIASGFMLRIIAGAWIINIEVSYWLILCTLFLSLFLGITKRRMEVYLVETSAITKTRKVLEHYSLSFTDQMSTIVAAGAVISYALYTVSERTIKIFGTDKLIFTTPFVIFGIFRYLYLVHKKNLGENPTQIVSTDFQMILNLVFWLLTSILIIYYKYLLNIFYSN